MSAPPEAPITYRGKTLVRILGVCFIAGCCVMVLLGTTVLSANLKGRGYVVYWSWCFVLAVLAMITAGVDMVLIRLAGRRSRRELFRREFMGK